MVSIHSSTWIVFGSLSASCPIHGVKVAKWEPNNEQAIQLEGCRASVACAHGPSVSRCNRLESFVAQGVTGEDKSGCQQLCPLVSLLITTYRKQDRAELLTHPKCRQLVMGKHD